MKGQKEKRILGWQWHFGVEMMMDLVPLPQVGVMYEHTGSQSMLS